MDFCFCLPSMRCSSPIDVFRAAAAAAAATDVEIVDYH